MVRRILVIGSIPNKSQIETLEKLCSSLGAAIVAAGQHVLNGGTSKLVNVDKYVAEGGEQACSERGHKVTDHILAIVREDSEPHNIGRFQIVTGDLDIEKRLSLIQRADAVIVIGGKSGTREYLVLAKLLKIPIIPIPVLGGVAREYYDIATTRIGTLLPETIQPSDLYDLNQLVTSDEIIDDISTVAVDLAKRSFSQSNYIFVAMPLRNDFNNALRAIKSATTLVNEAIDDAQYVCERIDEGKTPIKIDQEIENKITRAQLVIADVTENNPNVYYEVGFARGQGIAVIPIAKEGTNLPFDTQQIRTYFYSLDQNDIEALEPAIDKFAKTLSEAIKATPISRDVRPKP